MAVMLDTSLGSVVIDLHTDLCPLTSKNFLKLCKLKYYNNCIFHDVKKDFIAQTGDPTGTGSGGDSVYKLLYGDQARFFNDEFHPKLTHEKIGTVSMASAGEDMNASQFYITLRAGLDYLDGKHTVFGEVAEGLDTLMRISEAYVDEKGRPYKNIRIKHVDVIDDPFDDPPELADLIPERSPEIKLPAEGEEVRLEDDWIPLDEQMDAEELDKSIRRKEAYSRAVVLEMIGDIPEAEAAPPENVLFVCKLNPVTEEDDLKTIFSRFGVVVAADIIKDYKTGDSLCYGFIEFDNKESCEAAYFKMDNVLIDDRRIHVDFSQSVARIWNRFRKFGAKDLNGQGRGLAQGNGGGCFNCGAYGHLRKDCPNEIKGSANLGTKNSNGQDSVPVKGKGGECFSCGEHGHLKKDCPNEINRSVKPDAVHSEMPKYTLREPAGQRGNPRDKYDMVFENSDESPSHAKTAKRSSRSPHDRSRRKRSSEESDDEKRDRPRHAAQDSIAKRSSRDSHFRPRRKRSSEESDDEKSYRPRHGAQDSLAKRSSRDSHFRPKRKCSSEESDDEKRAWPRHASKDSLDDRSRHSRRNEGHRYAKDTPKDSLDDRSHHSRINEGDIYAKHTAKDSLDDRSYHSKRNESHRYAKGTAEDYGDDDGRPSEPQTSSRHPPDARRDHSRTERPTDRFPSDRATKSPVSSRRMFHDRRDHFGRHGRSGDRDGTNRKEDTDRARSLERLIVQC